MRIEGERRNAMFRNTSSAAVSEAGIDNLDHLPLAAQQLAREPGFKVRRGNIAILAEPSVCELIAHIIRRMRTVATVLIQPRMRSARQARSRATVAVVSGGAQVLAYKGWSGCNQ